MRLSSETVYFYITYVLIHHIAGINGIEWYFVARDTEIHQFLLTIAQDTDIDYTAFRTAQQFLYSFILHPYSGNKRVAYINDTVAGQDTHLFCRAARNGLNDIECVVNNLELNAYSFEVAVKLLGCLLQFVSRQIG